MNLKQELKNRGFIHQVAGGELGDVLKEKRTFYLGLDPSADSFQIGNLAPLMLAKRLIDHGHKAIILIGGATGQIGDPGGKKSERVLQDVKVIEKNAKAQIKQIQKLFGTKDLMVVNNADWLNKLNLIDFLRDIGKHFTVNSLIKRDLIKDRLQGDENSISYTEFSYALLQAYDFYHLHEKYNCDLQIGASDQWGNIVSGMELVRKKTGNSVYGLTMPLITDTTGKKFGKSEGNAVWLDIKKTSVFAFYQFWFNTKDQDVEHLLNIYTELTHEQIRDLMDKDPQARNAQKTLAHEATTLVHGEKEARAAQEASKVLFSGDLSTITKQTKKMLLEGAPSLSVASGDAFIDILIHAHLAQSKGEAKRLIEGGGVGIGNRKVSNIGETLNSEDFSNGLALLKKGKKEVVLLELT
ncbi:tyrosine--tRNA ligase [Candidatus Wolfebacteria bacterium]|nr:tyrosine--tRNA ligase [Candidatus Wolfebacteria bacterium]